jgi:hypothetical protein
MNGLSDIGPPRLERFGPMVLAGVKRRHSRTMEAARQFREVTAQWLDYVARRPAPLGLFDYGIFPRLADGATQIEYFCGAPFAGTGDLPPDFVTVALPELPCAVFLYEGHVTGLLDFIHVVLATVLPQAGLEIAPEDRDAPEFIERFGASYNPSTGMGGFDVLIPLKE